MTTNTVFTTTDLLEILEEAAAEIAESALDFEEHGRVSVKSEPTVGKNGVYVESHGDGINCKIGIVSDDPGFQTLARALMMLEPEDDPFPEEDVADAVGELTNLVAGTFNAQLVEREFAPSIGLGIPFHLNGLLTPMKSQEMAVSEFRIGETTVDLVVLLTINN